MAFVFPAKRLLLLLALASSTLAYSNNLWNVDFDTFHKWKIIEEVEECRNAYATLNHQPKNSNASAVIDCTSTGTDRNRVDDFTDLSD